MTESKTQEPAVITRPREPPFPRNVACWRNYTGLRALAILVFAASLLGLAGTCYTTTFQRHTIRCEAQASIDNRGLLKKAWARAYWYLWDRTPVPDQVRLNADAIVSRRRRWSLTEAALAWLLVWLAFDWDKARHFVFAALSVGAGALYSLAPVNLIPDFIPVAGVADDIIVNVFSAVLGAASVAEYYRARRRRELAARLVARHPEAALDIVLDDCGLERAEDRA